MLGLTRARTIGYNIHMKFNEISNTLVKATVKVEAIQIIGGWLVGQLGNSEEDVEYGKEFIMQAIFQMKMQGIQDTRGDQDMDKTFEFEIPVGRVCHLADMIRNADLAEKQALGLMTLWNPFVRAAQEVLMEALKPQRGYNELGPESLN